jgi:hypothetical protein
MKKAILIEQADLKRLIAERYEVPEKNVVKNQYSYTVILEEDSPEDNNEGGE